MLTQDLNNYNSGISEDKNSQPEDITGVFRTVTAKLKGPASGAVDLDGVTQGSNLYPLEESLKREGSAGHVDEDLGINSDGTNPGTEYLPPLNDLYEN